MEKIKFKTITGEMQCEAIRRGLDDTEMLFLSRDMLECVQETNLPDDEINEIMAENQTLFNKFVLKYIESKIPHK